MNLNLNMLLRCIGDILYPSPYTVLMQLGHLTHFTYKKLANGSTVKKHSDEEIFCGCTTFCSNLCIYCNISLFSLYLCSFLSLGLTHTLSLTSPLSPSLSYSPISDISENSQASSLSFARKKYYILFLLGHCLLSLPPSWTLPPFPSILSDTASVKFHPLGHCLLLIPSSRTLPHFQSILLDAKYLPFHLLGH